MDVTVCPSEGVGVAQALFLTLLQTLVRNQCLVANRDEWPKDYPASLSVQNEYDFIVVGSGSAGSPVASRLSENSDWKVLLIEAGGDPPIEATIPALNNDLIGTEYDWQYEAEPSELFGLAATGGPLWPRGKMIGGTGSINSMVYLRGFPRDYDNWKAQGNPGWGYDQVSKVFQRMENNQARNASDFEGTGLNGPLKIDYYYSQDTVRNVFLGAANELGYKWVTDFNAEDQTGFSFIQGTLTRGIRQSPGRTYLIQAAGRSNLHVVKFATVSKMIMEGNRAVGVEFVQKGRFYQVRATKEVILSAGAVGSPQILFNTGIGPREVLEGVGITQIHELAVGENLQNHAMVQMPFGFEEIEGEVSPSQMLDIIYAYFKNRTGPLTAPQPLDFVSFLNTESIYAQHSNIQVHHIVYPKNTPELLSELQRRRYQRRYMNQLLSINREMTVVIVYIILSNPKSKGYIVPRDGNPFTKPRIVTNYLTEPEDLETLVEGLKIYNKFHNTSAFQRMGGKFIEYDDLDCQDYPSDDYWRCFVRHFSNNVYHPASTCKMGPSSDPKAVVDSMLKVHGLQNVRVCDASIQPNIVSANINAASMMIGERCADFIKELYQQ